jgi:PII-like signaling protein
MTNEGELKMQRNPAKRLVVYLNVLDGHRAGTLYEAVVNLLRDHGCAGATVIKGVTGYGASRDIHKAKALSITADVPVRVEAVDTEEKINSVLPLIKNIVGKGVIEVHDTEMITFKKSTATVS